MQLAEEREIYNNFRKVLRDALNKKITALPRDVKYKFSQREVYRAVRISNNKNAINDSDFLSQIEKGMHSVDISNIENYSCSFFSCVDALKDAMHFPKKNKKIAKGKIDDSCGACLCNDYTKHIHLFRYDNVELADRFEVIGNE